MELQLPKCQIWPTEKPLARHAPSEEKRAVCAHGSHNMTTPASLTTTYISDDDSDANIAACPQCERHGWIGTYCSRCEDQGMTYTVPIPTRRPSEQRLSWRSRLAQNVLRLARVGRAGSELPPVGQVCLILHGVEGRDLGQQAVVTAQTKARVRVAYRKRNGRQGEKLKHPNSLVLLEDGLEMSQDERGFVWIKQAIDPI